MNDGVCLLINEIVGIVHVNGANFEYQSGDMLFLTYGDNVDNDIVGACVEWLQAPIDDSDIDPVKKHHR